MSLLYSFHPLSTLFRTLHLSDTLYYQELLLPSVIENTPFLETSRTTPL